MNVKIIGYAESTFKEREDELNAEELVFYTVKKALKNASLELKDIGTVVNSGDDILEGTAINNTFLVEPSGAFLRDETKVEEDGAFALFLAISKVLSEHETAMVVASSKSSQSSLANDPSRFPSYPKPEVSGSWYYHTQMEPFYLRPLGVDLVGYHALQYSAFLQNSGLNEEDIAKILVKNKNHGNLNPNAPHRGNYTVKDILESPYVMSPLRKLEMPLQTDGCSVLIISNEKWTKDNDRSAPSISGVGISSDVYYPGYRDLASCPSAKIATSKALQMSDKRIEQIQLAELYDLFPYQEALLYHEIFQWDYEKVKRYLHEEYTTEKGHLPVNISGGISCSHPIFAAGLSRIIHVCANLQAKGMKIGLAHSQSGLGMQSNIVYIIENE